jgi:hypothetical protein
MKLSVSIQRSNNKVVKINSFDVSSNEKDIDFYSGHGFDEFLVLGDLFQERKKYIDKNSTLTFVIDVRKLLRACMHDHLTFFSF